MREKREFTIKKVAFSRVERLVFKCSNKQTTTRGGGGPLDSQTNTSTRRATHLQSLLGRWGQEQAGVLEGRKVKHVFDKCFTM